MNPQAWVGGERGLQAPETRPLACLGREGVWAERGLGERIRKRFRACCTDGPRRGSARSELRACPYGFGTRGGER